MRLLVGRRLEQVRRRWWVGGRRGNLCQLGWCKGVLWVVMGCNGRLLIQVCEGCSLSLVHGGTVQVSKYYKILLQLNSPISTDHHNQMIFSRHLLASPLP